MPRLASLIALAVLAVVLTGTIQAGKRATGIDLLRETDRRWGGCMSSGIGNSSLSAIGGPGVAAGSTGIGLGGTTAACSSAHHVGSGGGPVDNTALTNATRLFVTFTSGALATNYGGWRTGSADTWIEYEPYASFIIHSGATNTAAVWWYGITSVDIGQYDPLDTDGVRPDYAAVAYDASQSAAWRCCTAGASASTCVNIPASTWAANTEYKVTVDLRVAGTTRCCVQAIASGIERCVAKTTDPPVGGQSYWLAAHVRTTEAVAKTVSVNRIYLEQN